MKGAQFVVFAAVVSTAWQGCALDGMTYVAEESPDASRAHLDTDGGATENSVTVGRVTEEALCPVGQERCGEVCIDPTVNRDHCGGCGMACGAGRVCTPSDSGSAATCALACVGGTMRCGDSCTRVESDPANCGACGNTCATGQACVKNACVFTACTPGTQELCYSGAAQTLGFGVCRSGRKVCNAAGTGFGACTGETLPASTDTCGDGVDNDCDGQVDEGCKNTLTLTKSGTGTGTVTSNPAGLACSASCSATFASGAVVRLTATPTAGHTFAWTGACLGLEVCNVTMDQARTVGITFTAPLACNSRRFSTSFTASTVQSFAVTPSCSTTAILAQVSSTCGRVSSITLNGTVKATLTQLTSTSATFSVPVGTPPVTSMSVVVQKIVGGTTVCPASITLN